MAERSKALVLKTKVVRATEGSNPSASSSGGLAHLVEHLLCTQKVIGSTPISSTNGDVAQW